MESPTAENATETQIELRTEGFQATLLWERIVSHLEKNVKCGRHSYALRSYDNCFPGHKAVDCLTAYMNSVLPKSVKKSQARLLGQKLLLTRVIEDARKKEKTVFRESRLYRFTGIHFWDPPRDMHGSFTGAEGGMHRCHSIENVNHGCPSSREQKRKSSGRRSGYMSDSTLAASSLSKRVVHVRSIRGKARLGGSVKSQLSTCAQVAPASGGQPSEGASPGLHRQPHVTHKPRLPWFHSNSAAKAREIRSKYRTPTINEEPYTMSPPRAATLVPRSPASDFGVRVPRSRGFPTYLERPHSPDSSVVSGISGYSMESQEGPLRCRDYALHSHGPGGAHPRLVPRPAVTVSSAAPTKSGRSDSAYGTSLSEPDPNWITYGYV